MRYRLRTLLIALALGPPVLAASWFGWCKYQERQRQKEFDELIELIQTTVKPVSSVLSNAAEEPATLSRGQNSQIAK